MSDGFAQNDNETDKSVFRKGQGSELVESVRVQSCGN